MNTKMIKIKSMGEALILAMGISGAIIPIWNGVTADCSHTRSGSKTISVCVRCTPMGPIPQNEGLIGCSYYFSDRNVFCEDCAPCFDCFTNQEVAATIILCTGGRCYQGGCIGATNNSAWVQILPIRGDGPCRIDPYEPCLANR